MGTARACSKVHNTLQVATTFGACVQAWLSGHVQHPAWCVDAMRLPPRSEVCVQVNTPSDEERCRSVRWSRTGIPTQCCQPLCEPQEGVICGHEPHGYVNVRANPLTWRSASNMLRLRESHGTPTPIWMHGISPHTVYVKQCVGA